MTAIAWAWWVDAVDTAYSWFHWRRKPFGLNWTFWWQVKVCVIDCPDDSYVSQRLKEMRCAYFWLLTEIYKVRHQSVITAGVQWCTDVASCTVVVILTSLGLCLQVYSWSGNYRLLKMMEVAFHRIQYTKSTGSIQSNHVASGINMIYRLHD